MWTKNENLGSQLYTRDYLFVVWKIPHELTGKTLTFRWSKNKIKIAWGNSIVLKLKFFKEASFYESNFCLESKVISMKDTQQITKYFILVLW